MCLVCLCVRASAWVTRTLVLWLLLVFSAFIVVSGLFIRTAPLHLDDYLKLICFLSTSVYSALGVSAIMRYINRRFTYFTYLLTYTVNVSWWCCRDVKDTYQIPSSILVTVWRSEFCQLLKSKQSRPISCSVLAPRCECRLLVTLLRWVKSPYDSSSVTGNVSFGFCLWFLDFIFFVIDAVSLVTGRASDL